MNAREEFRAAIQAAGLSAPEHIIADGKVHRFASNGNPRGDAGWYWMHDDERPLGKFGCWKHGIEVQWSARVQREFTPEERAAWKAKMQESERLRAEAQRQEREQAATMAADMWSRAGDADGHPYLERKQVLPLGIRLLEGELLVPMRAGPGAYVGLQRILPDGGKFFLSGTPAGGAYHVIGKPEKTGRVVIAEGYATAASVHIALGCCVVVAFNAGNLLPVARKIREAMPDAAIVIAADDDAWTEGNPGITAANAAAAAVCGTVCVPIWANGRPTKHTDFNDLHCDESLDAVRACFEPTPGGSGRDQADSVSAAHAANNPASVGTGAAPTPVAAAVDVPPARSTGSHTVGGVASDVNLPDGDLFIYAGSPLDTAQVFQDSLPDDGKIYFWRGDFYMWNGHRYQVRDHIYLHQRLYNFMAACVTQKKNPETGDFEVVQFKPKKSHIEDVMHVLRAVCFVDLPEPPAWIIEQDGDPDPGDIMSFRNGFLHVPTRTLLPATPRLFITNALDFDYNPEAPAPAEWIRFLQGIWPNDPQAIEAMADMFGYMLTADTSQQKMFMLIGPPRSGKGTILRVLQSVVGLANRVSPSLSSLGTQFGLQPLIGKRLGMISDARLSGKADQAPIVENMLRISGEDSITLDRKNREAWSGKLSVRFVLAANETPNFTDASGALPNRFIMFKMEKSNLGNEDQGLTTRLLRELPGIVLWALDGLDRLRARGYLLMPESGREIADEMREQASPVTSFVADMCVLDPLAEIDRSVLYQTWVDWCKGNGMDHPGTVIGFGRKLSAALPGLSSRRPREDGLRVSLWSGIRLRHGYESPV